MLRTKMYERLTVLVNEIQPGVARVTVLREWLDPATGLILDATAEDLGVHPISRLTQEINA